MHILQSILKYVTRSWYPVAMCDFRVSTYPGINVFHCVSAYPRIHFTTYYLEVYLGRGGTFDCVSAYPAFSEVQLQMAGYSAVKPKHDIPFILVDIQIHRGLGDQNLS